MRSDRAHASLSALPRSVLLISRSTSRERAIVKAAARVAERRPGRYRSSQTPGLRHSPPQGLAHAGGTVSPDPPSFTTPREGAARVCSLQDPACERQCQPFCRQRAPVRAGGRRLPVRTPAVRTYKRGCPRSALSRTRYCKASWPGANGAYISLQRPKCPSLNVLSKLLLAWPFRPGISLGRFAGARFYSSGHHGRRWVVWRSGTRSGPVPGQYSD